MKALTLIISATAFCVTSDLLPAQEIENFSLAELKEAIKAKDKSKILTILEVSNYFHKAVSGETFEPASDVAFKISAGEDVLVNLANEILADKWPVNSPEVESVMASFHLLFAKIDALLEEGYQRQPVTSNVSPPLGTPNAAAGMNPDAIKDPVLKQQYLELIKKNQTNGFKNIQQLELNSARWKAVILAFNLINWAEQKGASKEQILDKLAPEGKSKSLLKEKLAPSTKASVK
jgi:hypothetical protein